MRDTKTITPLIGGDFAIDQYSSGSLNLQYARQIPTGDPRDGIEQLPFVLGVRGACTVRREAYPAPDSPNSFYRSDQPYTVTLGETITTKET